MQNSTNALNSTTTGSILKVPRPEKLNINFDHLSVVSEECLSNSDDQNEQQKQQQRLNQGDEVFAPEASAERLFADFHSTVPPLTHFENLSYKDIGPNVGKSAKAVYLFTDF